MTVLADVATPTKNSPHAELTRLKSLPRWLRMIAVGSVLRFASCPAPAVVVLFETLATCGRNTEHAAWIVSTYTVSVPVVVVKVVLAVSVVDFTTVTVGAAT